MGCEVLATGLNPSLAAAGASLEGKAAAPPKKGSGGKLEKEGSAEKDKKNARTSLTNRFAKRSVFFKRLKCTQTHTKNSRLSEA